MEPILPGFNRVKKVKIKDTFIKTVRVLERDHAGDDLVVNDIVDMGEEFIEGGTVSLVPLPPGHCFDTLVPTYDLGALKKV